MALHDRPKSLILAEIESAYTTLLIMNHGRILTRFRNIAGFLLKTTALHPSSIRILGCSLYTTLKILDLRDAKTLS